MEPRPANALLILVLVQACHSVEEYVFRLWEALPPARFVAGALGFEPALGFAVSNSLLLGFGLWCWLVPVRRGWRSAAVFAWGWALVEAGNGCAHVALATAAGGYFPGLYTTPLLLAAAAWLIASLGRRRAA
jgi:hypothetical protein